MEQWSSHEPGWERRGRGSGSEELGFRFGHTELEMSVKQSSVDVMKVVGYMSLEFRGKSW